MTTTLFRGARLHTPYDPAATCLAVTDGVISWIGTEHGIPQAGAVDRVVDVGGALITPAFVDAHVHVTDAGLAAVGLDLSSTRSLGECLDRIRAHAAIGDGVLWGHGWDETAWPEGRAPRRAELDAVVGRRPTYLSRIDVHSALVSSALVDGLADLDGFHPELPLTRQANAAARESAPEAARHRSASHRPADLPGHLRGQRHGRGSRMCLRGSVRTGRPDRGP